MANAIAKTQTGIGRKARITDEPYQFRVTLYDTVIYEESPSTVWVAHGGWMTPTTARYINQCFRYRGHTARVRIVSGRMYLQTVEAAMNEVSASPTLFEIAEVR